MEESPEGSLPFLGLQQAMCVRLIIEKALEIVFADGPTFRTRGKSQIHIICDQVGAIDKSHLRIEIWFNRFALCRDLHQIAGIAESDIVGPVVSLQPWISRKCLAVVGEDSPLLPQHKVQIHAGSTIEAVSGIGTLLIQSDRANVRLRQKSPFHAGNCVIGRRIKAALARMHIEDAEVEVPPRSCQFRSSVERDLLSTVGIDPDLPAEEKLGAALIAKLKNSAVFQKERALLRKKDPERCKVEAQRVYVRIGKVSIYGYIRQQVAANSILQVHSPTVQSVLASDFVGAIPD